MPSFLFAPLLFGPSLYSFFLGVYFNFTNQLIGGNKLYYPFTGCTAQHSTDKVGNIGSDCLH